MVSKNGTYVYITCICLIILLYITEVLKVKIKKIINYKSKLNVVHVFFHNCLCLSSQSFQYGPHVPVAVIILPLTGKEQFNLENKCLIQGNRCNIFNGICL